MAFDMLVNKIEKFSLPIGDSILGESGGGGGCCNNELGSDMEKHCWKLSSLL